MENGQGLKSWEQIIEAHIELTESWINEAKFESQAEMIYAQNMRHINAEYRRRKAEARRDNDPQAS